MRSKHTKPVTSSCSNCGEVLNAGVKTCPRCGHYNA